MYKKKFTTQPGLGINHIEQETTVAHHWNQCIDEGVGPDTFIKVSEVRERNFKFQNYETGKSLENTGYAIEKGGKWRLSDEAIEKCKAFLGIKD